MSSNALSPTPNADLTALLTSGLLDEIFRGIEGRYNGLLRRRLPRLFAKPAQRMAAILARADAAAQASGLQGAAASVIQDLRIPYKTLGADQIPASGPLILASNHPAGYDMLVLGAASRRPDLAVIASDLPLYHQLKHIWPHIIGVSPGESGRFTALRRAIAHLSAGGALLQFPAGRIEPDPQCEPGAFAALQDWKPSLELFLRKVPQTQLVLAMASGVLERAYRNSPITWLRSHPKDKRRLAEFLQVAKMLLKGTAPRLTTYVSFGPPVNLGLDELASPQEPVQGLARAALQGHLDWLKSEGLQAYA